MFSTAGCASAITAGEEGGMKRLQTILSIGLLALPLAFGQSNGPPSQSGKTRSTDKVTTDDSVYNPNGGPGDKTSDDAKTKAKPKKKRPETPPNPPVVSPHEDPTSPVNRPKEGNVPEKGNVPQK
jgi:hypothetical protein